MNLHPTEEIVAILGVLTNHRFETFGMFRPTYNKYFDHNEVPIIEVHAQTVTVNTQQAITYLKRRYGLHTPEEARKLVADEYKDLMGDRKCP